MSVQHEHIHPSVWCETRRPVHHFKLNVSPKLRHFRCLWTQNTRHGQKYVDSWMRSELCRTVRFLHFLPLSLKNNSSSTTASEEDDTVNIPLFHRSDSLCVYKLLQIKYQSLQTTNSCYNSSCDINLIRGEMTFFFLLNLSSSLKTLPLMKIKQTVCVCVFIFTCKSLKWD